VLHLTVDVRITSYGVHLAYRGRGKLLLVNHEVINIVNPIGSCVIDNMIFVTCHLILCIWYVAVSNRLHTSR
jgi:hypothetical protein